MKVLSFFILFLLLSSCNSKQDDVNTTIPSGLFYKHLNINGINRRYAVYIPQNINNDKLPVVFELHGGGVYIEDMTGDSGYKTPYKLWMQIADTARFIVVYPEGLNGAYNAPTWNDCREDCLVNSGADDVNFIEQLISEINRTCPVDFHRIYISGTSNGGLMSLRMAVERPQIFAAFAVTAAALPAVSSCGQPQSSVNILFMNGTDDNHMPYHGGTVSNPPNPAFGTVLSTDETVNIFKELAQINNLPEYFLFPDLDPDDGGQVEKFTYKNTAGEPQVILYKINGGGHSAPSIREQYSTLFEEKFNKQNHDIEMVFEVWNFFRNKSTP